MSRPSVDDVGTVRLAGELDMSAWTELGDLLVHVVESNRARPIVLDLSDLRFIDAHSIGLIVAAWTTATRSGRGLRVSGLHGLLEQVFRVLGLQQLLTEREAEEIPGGDIGGRSDSVGRTHDSG
jgi:anti-anti-sigma factor